MANRETAAPVTIQELLVSSLAQTDALAKEGIIPGAKIGTSWRFNRFDLENYVRAVALRQIDKEIGLHV